MAFDYSQYLTDAQKKALLENNLSAWAADHYANQLNLKIALDAGNEDGIVAATANIATIEAAANVALGELESIPQPASE